LTLEANPNSQERASTVYVYADGNAPALYKVVQPGQGGCQVSATPGKTDIPATGGTGALAIAAPPGCTWTAKETNPWVKLLSDKSGSGDASITFQVDENASTQARTASIQVNEEVQVDLTQFGKDIPPPPCLLTVSPDIYQVGSDGGDFLAEVTANRGDCSWAASASDSFISFPSGANRTGTQGLAYRVTPNPQGSDMRQASILIGNQSLVVRQAAGPKSPCVFNVSPLSFPDVEAAGRTVTVTVNTTADCAWTSSTSSNFVTISSGSSVTGNGTVTLVISANSTNVARQAAVSIANRTVNISQVAGGGGGGGGVTGILTIAPNPIRTCTNGLGRATLSWNIPGAGQLSLRVNSPTGAEMGKFPERGSAETGDWVTDGMEFFLVDTAGRTVARATARLECGSQPEQASLTASPNPIQVCPPANLGKTTLTWSAPGRTGLSLRVGAPDGANMGGVDSRGSTETGDWVTNGMEFFLVTSGGQVLAQTTVRHTTEGCAPAGGPPPNIDLFEGDIFAWRAEATFRGQPADLVVQPENVAVQDGANSYLAASVLGDRISLQYPADPAGSPLRWDMRSVSQARAYLITDALGQTRFLTTSPKLILRSPQGIRTLSPSNDVISASRGRWTLLNVPLAGGSGWAATDQGSFDLGNVTSLDLEVQADGPGIALLWDGLRFVIGSN
jgi:hypothetical protein